MPGLEDKLVAMVVQAIGEKGQFSLNELAARADITASTLSDFVKRKGSLRLPQAERLAKALGYRIAFNRITSKPT
jgi:transcriptional regulator with XRE-family HTH domain